MKTALIHVRLLRETGEVTENGYILFDEKEILKLGTGEPVLEHTGETTIIDGEGKTLMPGLIDCHVHLGYRNMSTDVPEIEQGIAEYSGPKWTIVRSESTAIKCLIGACHYLSILNNVKPASHHKVALGLTLLRILSKVDKPINAGIHVRNVGTQFSGITVL